MRKIHLVSIILPTYNENENIIPLIKEIKLQVSDRKQIIVVDDNSPDGTSQTVINYLIKSHDREVILETRKKDRGLTRSISRGIELARGEVIIWLDCDFSHPPEVIKLLLAKIMAGFDIAVASRYIPGGQAKSIKKNDKDIKTSVIFSSVINRLATLLLSSKFNDWTSGFVAARRSVFDKITLRGDYGEYFIDFIYRAIGQKKKIIEVPFSSPPRKYGYSKTGQSLMSIMRRGRKYIILLGELLIKGRILHTIP